MYSVPLHSSRRPPASLFEARTAAVTLVSGTSSAASRTGSTVIWYWRAKPPTVATSATPSTACKA